MIITKILNNSLSNTLNILSAGTSTANIANEDQIKGNPFRLYQHDGFNLSKYGKFIIFSSEIRLEKVWTRWGNYNEPLPRPTLLKFSCFGLNCSETELGGVSLVTRPQNHQDNTVENELSLRESWKVDGKEFVNINWYHTDFYAIYVGVKWNSR